MVSDSCQTLPKRQKLTLTLNSSTQKLKKRVPSTYYAYHITVSNDTISCSSPELHCSENFAFIHTILKLNSDSHIKLKITSQELHLCQSPGTNIECADPLMT